MNEHINLLEYHKLLEEVSKVGTLIIFVDKKD